MCRACGSSSPGMHAECMPFPSSHSLLWRRPGCERLALPPTMGLWRRRLRPILYLHLSRCAWLHSILRAALFLKRNGTRLSAHRVSHTTSACGSSLLGTQATAGTDHIGSTGGHARKLHSRPPTPTSTCTRRICRCFATPAGSHRLSSRGSGRIEMQMGPVRSHSRMLCDSTRVCRMMATML